MDCLDSNNNRLNIFKKNFLIIIVTFLASILFSFSIVLVSNFIKNSFTIKNETIKHSIPFFYVFFFGMLTSIWKPTKFGWCFGEIKREYKLIILGAIMYIILGILFVLLLKKNPYNNFPWTQYIIVPVGEEALCRGFVFYTLYSLFIKYNSEEKARNMTIVISGISFGLLHASIIRHNYLFGIITIIYTSISGIFFGYVRLKTKSLFPSMLFHGIVNFITNRF